MISEDRDQRRDAKTLLWAFLASILIHALVLPATFWSWTRDLLLSQQPPKHEWVVSSTAVRIERRTVPQPRSRPVPPPRPVPQQPQPVPPRPQTVLRPVARPEARREEIAREAPTALPEAKRPERTAQPSLEQQLQQQEQTFSQEVARLREQNNPLSIAAPREPPASAWHRGYFDVPGHVHRNEVEAILIPLRHWYAGSMSCYYVRYNAQFTEGGSEDGVIPWPVCYPSNNDVMVNPPYPHDLPIPVPQRDYVLPSGTYLTPLLRSIYDRRS
jgi:outer membrane biosynthesis protein TonB